MTIEPLTPERRRQQTRDHLLRAAAHVFAEQGYAGATLDDVATAAGFTKGAVYSNFKNKEDLFLALLKAAFDRETEALRTTLDRSAEPADARLGDFVELFRLPPEEGTNLNLLYLEFLLYAARHPSARAELARIEDESVEALAEIIVEERRRQGLEPLESPVETARLVEALFRGVNLLRQLKPEAVDDAFIEAAISFAARGLDASID